MFESTKMQTKLRSNEIEPIEVSGCCERCLEAKVANLGWPMLLVFGHLG